MSLTNYVFGLIASEKSIIVRNFEIAQIVTKDTKARKTSVFNKD